MATTKSLKKCELDAKWYLIDATDCTLGRLAAYTANILRGKNKATWTPFYWHTTYPGGIKERTLGQMRAEKPTLLVKNAVKRMMGRRTAVALADKRLTKLHVYAGAEHKHAAQNPVVIDFAGLNRKNKRGE